MNIFFTGLFLLLLGGIIPEYVPHRFKTRIFCLFSVSGSLLTGFSSLFPLLGTPPLEMTLHLGFPAGDCRFILDALSSFFVFIFSLAFALVSVYSTGYLSFYLNAKKERLHFLFLSCLPVSMMLAIASANALVFLIFWEIMTLSSFFLAAFENEKQEVYEASLYYLVAMHIGAVFLITAFAYLTYACSSYDFKDLKTFLLQNPRAAQSLFFMVFIGFGTKAGFFPFHSWLPKAHPAAPSHVSALMSGIMIKTGLYGIFRFLSWMEMPTALMGYFLLFLSLFTAFYGILFAMNEKDIKKQLAYSSIENIGIMGIGLSTGMLGLSYGNSGMALFGFAGSFLHLFNHSLFKTALFLSAGNVYIHTHQKNMEKLGGLIKTLPSTSLVFILSAAAISGLPPLNGFISEFYLYLSMLKGISSSPILFVSLISAFALLAFIGALAVLTFTKTAGVAFLGQPRSALPPPFPESKSRTIPLYVLLGLLFVSGMIPQIFIPPLKNILPLFGRQNTFQSFASLETLSFHLSAAVFSFLFLLLLLLGIRRILLKKRTVASYKTWCCGYEPVTARMQYTASSFSADPASISYPLLPVQKECHKPEGIFPEPSHIKISNPDLIDAVIQSLILNPIQFFFNRVSLIQSRTSQHYVLYLILFVVLTFLWIIGNK